MRALVKTFKALSDPNRIRILKMLQVRSLCVCEITEVLHLAASTVSKHLSILRDAEFIIDEKEGKWVWYKLNDEESGLYVNQLLPLLENWLAENEKVQDDQSRVKKVDRKEICGA